jgi:FkbH-like protein
MVRAQVQRETQRKQMSREEFLASLELRVDLFEIPNTEHPRFKRVIELINKSNQFNTTGKRWTEQECASAMSSGTKFLAFDVTDKFTPYGLVGVVIVNNANIEQFVMSCRVNGSEIEIAVIGKILGEMSRSFGAATAAFTETSANLVARDLWKRNDFEFDGAQWARSLSSAIHTPEHVRFVEPALAEAAE